MKISAAFDLYVREYMSVKGMSKSRMRHYEGCKRSLVEALGDKALWRLRTRDVERWTEWLKASRGVNTVRDYLSRLRVVLRYARSRGVWCLDYDLVPLPKKMPTEATFLTADEVARMIAAAPSAQAKFIIALLYGSGIRLAELLTLQRDQIKGRQFTIIGKGKKLRLCFIDERTERLMREYLRGRNDNCPALVVSEKYGRPLSAVSVQTLVREAARAAGINKRVTPHTLRHSFATNFLQNNGNMRYLATLMGHANLETTAHYAHVVDNDLRDQYLRCHTE